MQRLPLVVHTTYAELMDQCQAIEKPDWPLTSQVKAREVKGTTQWYLQHSRRFHGGKQPNDYLGPDTDEALRQKIAEFRVHKERYSERQQMVRALKGAGVPSPTGPMAALVEALGEAGVLGNAIVVGTLAFQVYSAQLGVRFTGQQVQTMDLDLTQAEQVELHVVKPSNFLLDELRRVDETFQPAMPLSHGGQPTSYVGQRGLRVDVLMPLSGPEKEVIPAPALGSAGQAVRFLGYLVEETMPAVLLAGGGVLTKVPKPARFALHKLIIAGRRPGHEQAKRRKDIAQAGQLIQVLLEDDDDSLARSLQSLLDRGPKWRAGYARGLALLPEAQKEALEDFWRSLSG